jgi:hypothetical protein
MVCTFWRFANLLISGLDAGVAGCAEEELTGQPLFILKNSKKSSELKIVGCLTIKPEPIFIILSKPQRPQPLSRQKIAVMNP